MRLIYFFIPVIFFLASVTANAQIDSNKSADTTISSAQSSKQLVNDGREVLLDTIKPKKDSATTALAKKDSVIEKKHIPRKATLRSAIIPGWGQAYNREYWKIPIVYGALAVPASLFAYNNKWYQRTKTAYNILVNGLDSSKIDPKLQNIDAPSLQNYRNTFRKDRDYSVLFFVLVWGLNVADATVFAHLKDFDVSNNLSMRIQPDFNINTKSPSLLFALNLKTKQPKKLPAEF